MRILEGITKQYFLLWIEGDLPKSNKVVWFQMGRLPGEGREIESKKETHREKESKCEHLQKRMM